VQKNYITIPKSIKQERILENADIFDFAISDEDMKKLVSVPLTNKKKLRICHIHSLAPTTSYAAMYNYLVEHKKRASPVESSCSICSPHGPLAQSF